MHTNKVNLFTCFYGKHRNRTKSKVDSIKIATILEIHQTGSAQEQGTASRQTVA